MANGTSKHWKFGRLLLLALAAPVAFIALAEAVLRISGAGCPTSFLVESARGRWVDNQFFGYRFFPPRLARTSPPIRLAMPKPADTVRVFVLGESAAMGEPMPEFGLARQLEAVLAGRFPGRTFEVVNAAMTAINSHVIVEIAEDLAKFQPDVFVVYAGNNEVIGPYGPGTVFEPFSRSPAVNRLRAMSTRLRLGQLLRALLPSPAPETWRGLEMFEERVPQDDPRLKRVYGQFAANLQRIAVLGESAGADVVLSTVAVNLRDCAPFGRDERADEAFLEGRDLEEKGAAAACTALARARDLDPLRFRADSGINQMIREVARLDGQVRLLDAETMLGGGARAPGRDLFLDHVHLNLHGTYLLACAAADEIGALPRLQGATVAAMPAEEDVRARLLVTPWSELDVVESLLEREKAAPFAGRPGNAEELMALAREKVRLRGETKRADLDRLGAQFEKAIAARPDDGATLAGWGRILYAEGRFADAQKSFEQALALAPHRYELRADLAVVLGLQGRADDGVKVIVGDGRKNGRFAFDYLLKTAHSLAGYKRFAESLAFVDAALRISPRDPDAALEKASRCAALGKLDEAESVLRDLIRREPGNTVAIEDLAELTLYGGNVNEAAGLLEKAMTAAPERPDAEWKLAMLRLRRDEIDEGRKLLEEVVRRFPGFAPAQVVRGQMYEREEKLADAERCYRAAIAAAPDMRDAWSGLQSTLIKLSREEEAREAQQMAAGLQ